MLIFAAVLFSICIEFVHAKAKTKVKASPAPKAKVEAPKEPPNDEPNAELVIEDGVYVSVFPEKGLNWKITKNCKTIEECAKVKALAWPDKSAEVWIRGEKEKAKTIDPYTGDEVIEEYYLVDVKYKRKDSSGQEQEGGGRGWIEASFVKFKEKEKEKNPQVEDQPLVSIDLPQPLPPPPKKSKDCNDNIQDNLDPSPLSEIKPLLKKEELEMQVEKLMEKVGQCVQFDKDKAVSSGKLNYDLFILPKLKKEKLPQIEKMVGHSTFPMDHDDLISIDAIARTLFGEVARCFKKGLQHPLAVSKIIDNRYVSTFSKNESKKEKKRAKAARDLFMPEEKKQDKDLPRLAKIVTSPSQFNVWMSTHMNKEGEIITNPALTHALCPVSEKWRQSDKYKKGNLIPHEVSVWKNAVRIATEIVLHKHAFNDRFPEQKNGAKPARTMGNDIFNYTSYTEKFYDYKPVQAQVEGHNLDKEGCVKLWKK